MTSRTLICCAFPFGYGPAAKLLHLARDLKGHGWRLLFLGTGIALELASRSPWFDDIVQASPAEALPFIRSASGLLSLMDRDYAAVAVELGRPLFVVDSLLWMRDQIPEAFRHARRYWAQHFVGVQERLAEIGPNAVAVGPIVAPLEAGRRERGTHWVVNLGGSESTQGWNPAESGYFDLILRALGAGVSPFATQGEVMLLAGSGCIRYLRDQYPKCGMTLCSLPHDEALRLLGSAQGVVTAPGLTACLECFQQGVPTFFLPPQNYSQWWILKHLRSRGLAPGSLHWEDMWPDNPIVERMPEDIRAPLLRAGIRRCAGDVRAEGLLRKGLASALAGDSDDLGRRQRAFFDSLGPNGTAQIVTELAHMI
jgi:hypothetical protein